MDPDECLFKIRRLVAALLGDDKGWMLDEDAVELAEHVDALDDWIRSGGFLPAAWARAQPVRPQ